MITSIEFNTPEINRIILIIGAFTAVNYKDRKGVIPGGIIVPGFIVILMILSPLWCLAVLASSYAIYAIYAIYNQCLKRVDHRRRTPMYILAFLSLILTYPVALLYMKIGILPTALDSLSGTIIPAVIALSFSRQGVPRVCRGMAITTAITALITALILAFGHWVVGNDLNYLNRYYQTGEGIHFNVRVLQFLACLLVGYLIYRHTEMRAGGYMVAPIAAGLLLQPLRGIVFITGCLFTYLAIKLISRYSLIVGLRRYATGLLYSIIYVWGVELLFIRLGIQELPFQGNHLFVVIAIMSYANDCTLHGARRVVPWMLISILVMVVFLILTGSIPT
jgi:hypothetical protein